MSSVSGLGGAVADGEPVTYELASWGTRAAALALDLLVAAALAIPIAIGVYVVEGSTGEDAERLTRTLAYAIGIPFGLLYAPLMMLRRGPRNGQTLGKQAMRIRVVRERGGAMNLSTGLLREVIGRQLLVAFTYGLYAVVDYLWPLWDAQRQCLHDKVAQTRVVRVDAPAPAPPHGGRHGAHGLHAAPPPPPPPPRAEDERPVRDGWLPPAAGR